MCAYRNAGDQTERGGSKELLEALRAFSQIKGQGNPLGKPQMSVVVVAKLGSGTGRGLEQLPGAAWGGLHGVRVRVPLYGNPGWEAVGVPCPIPLGLLPLFLFHPQAFRSPA